MRKKRNCPVCKSTRVVKLTRGIRCSACGYTNVQKDLIVTYKNTGDFN